MGPASARSSASQAPQAASRLRFSALVFACGLALLAFGEGSRLLFSQRAPRIAIDIGPSTGMYLDGFTESEERMPATFRWTRERAAIALPLDRRGDRGRLTIRYARFLPGNARVRVFLDGSPAASFSARSGRFRSQELELDLPGERGAGGGPLRLEFLVEDPSPEKLGIAVDWVAIEGMRVGLRSSAPRALLAGLVFLGLAAGFSLATVAGLGSALALLQAVGFAAAPFAATHVQAQLAAGALIATTLAGLLTRERRVALLFLVAFLLKGSALFHPSYFYPDVRLHRRHLEAFVAAEGGVVERGIAAQRQANTAYPRLVAGKPYVFPYSPVFYLPFTLFERDARGMEALMKHAGLWLAALEVPLVFFLARGLLGTTAGLWAALLAAFLPPLTSRLLFAQWPTLAGHALDVLALIAASRLLSLPRAPRALLSYGAAAWAASLMYISSILNTSLLTAALAIGVRDGRMRLKLVLLGAAVAVATACLLYLPFLRVFFQEILPAMIEHGGSGSPGSGVMTTLAHVYFFYGVGYIGFSAAGIWIARARSEPAFRFLVIYAASFLALLALRASAGMFKDLKDLVYVGPLVAVACGAFLEALTRSMPTRPRRAAAVALAVAAGLIAFSLAKHVEYFRMHATLAQ